MNMNAGFNKMKKTSVVIGKIVRGISRIRGGGSALPGLIVEKYDKNFLNDVLSRLPQGVVVVSGTNGKTTTTKIITELFESQNLKVFTNKTGSNFTRGVISEIIGNIKDFKFNFDIAVIELDEAHAIKFISQTKPDYALLLNAFQDQVERFETPEETAKLLTKIAKSAKKAVILNREDPLIACIASTIPRSKKIVYYGYSPKLSSNFPVDDEPFCKKTPKVSTKTPLVELQSFVNNKIMFKIEQKTYTTKMSLTGVYNYFNAAGALATVLSVCENAKIDPMLKALSKTTAAFGRGEKLSINNNQVELILIKNPVGFKMSLQSHYKSNLKTMIAINDHYADGRDIEWLKNVDFSMLKSVSVVTGLRASDMAQFLQDDGVKTELIETNIKSALRMFLNKPGDKQIFTSYTAMLEIRKFLNKMSEK